MNTKQLLKLTLTLATLTLLTACGKSTDMVGSSDASSTESASTAYLAYCSQGSGSDITAKLKAAQTTSSGYSLNYVYVRLTSLPTNFKSGSNYIAMWKWLANSTGSTHIDSANLNFTLIDSTTNKAITGWVKTLRWSDVSTAASAMGISDAQTFFNRVSILVDLQDSTGQYDALKISNYNASTNKAESQVDALLPLFAANPNTYANDNGSTRAAVLQSLHPMASQKSQGWSSAQYQTMTSNLCF